MKNLNDNESFFTKEELLELSEMNHSEQCFMDGMYSEELPSEMIKNNDNRLIGETYE